MKGLNIENKNKKILWVWKEKKTIYKNPVITIALDFSTAASSKTLKVNNIQLTIVYLTKLLIIIEGRIETLLDIQGLKMEHILCKMKE